MKQRRFHPDGLPANALRALILRGRPSYVSELLGSLAFTRPGICSNSLSTGLTALVDAGFVRRDGEPRRYRYTALVTSLEDAIKSTPAEHHKLRTKQKNEAATAANDEPETVEAFQARGGKIEQLAPHASATPLRFDYSKLHSQTNRRARGNRPRSHAA
ncbi:MAG: hypothetical protein JSR63_07985 [Proteobacteria bacterium]|nr:hypothetical protein [Pseudomonadota bacterium]